MSKKKPKFPNHICVKFEHDTHDPTGGYFLIVGSPDDVSRFDAEDGDKIGTYVLNGPVKVYRQNPRLEK